MSEYRIGTKCVQGGYTPGNGEPRQVPIIQSTTFKYKSSILEITENCKDIYRKVSVPSLTP